MRQNTPRGLSWPAAAGLLLVGALLLPLLPAWARADEQEETKAAAAAARAALERAAAQLADEQRRAAAAKALAERFQATVRSGVSRRKEEVELARQEADLQKKLAEIRAARAKLRAKARAKAKEGKDTKKDVLIQRGGPSIRIEISGLNLKGDEL